MAQSPIPCVAVYCVRDRTFHSFSINGSYLQSMHEDARELISPVTARDSFFNNCLVYLQDSGNTLVVRKFPFLEKVKSLSLRKAATALSVSDNQQFVLLGNEDGTCTLAGCIDKHIGSLIKEPLIKS